MRVGKYVRALVRTFHEVDSNVGGHSAESFQPQHHGDLSPQILDLTSSALCVLGIRIGWCAH